MTKHLVNVSRETNEKLIKFSDLVKKWTPRINLVSKSTIPDLWNRHIIDSIQLNSMINNSVKHWVDLGSGGGFPGLVIAICALEDNNPENITLVESDQRKAVFLQTVIRELDLNAEVKTDRIEALSPLKADVLSARALADLETLLRFSMLHLKNDGIALFLKGKAWQKELAQARKKWVFDCNVIQSQTSSESVVLKIAGVTSV